MSCKFFDITFKTRSSAGDFSCKDGEVESSSLSTDCDTLSNYPPRPDVDFAIVRDILKGWHVVATDFPSKNVIASEPSMEYWNSMAKQMLIQFQSEAFNQNLFVSPFYAMAVWKTYDGSFLSCSQPVKLIPNSEIPLVGTTGDISASEIEMKIAAALGDLRLRMRAPEVLRDFVGIIESLQIFVSQPLHDYGRIKACIPSKRVFTDSFCESLDPATGIISQKRISTMEMPVGWQTSHDIFPLPSSNVENLKFSLYGEIPLSDVDLWDNWRSVPSYSSWGESVLAYSQIQNTGKNLKAEDLVIEGTGEDINIITRPIKLSCAGELKRVSRVSLRGKYTPDNLTLSVYGSRDMLNWFLISKKRGGTVAVLPRSSFRFFKVSVSGPLGEGENLQGLEFRTCSN